METLISDDPALLDIAAIHRFLSNETAWARGIPLATLQRAIANSICFGAYEDGRQVGFARAVTDRATFAYLCDVYTLPTHRGRGIARKLVEAMHAHPELQLLRRSVLVSTDARGLYDKLGWTAVAQPQTYMERFFPAVYKASKD
ncbi:MAG TPA: GNAT family N-acetyltransferase [Burkholderiaceae bacterium]